MQVKGSVLIIGSDALLALDEYTRLFGGSLRAHQRRAKAGRWKSATKLAGRWYVTVTVQALEARVRAIEVIGSKKSVRASEL